MISNVMLVDDEEFDQMIYKRVLERSGIVENIHPFFYAEDALSFLKSTERPQIDVIFLDINMPRMSGFEFLEIAKSELDADFADAVIVMLTTSLDPSDQARAARYEIVRDFINKPLTVEHVKNVQSLIAAGRAV